MKKEFEFGMKVSLNGEFGVLIQSSDSIEPGIIRWDTKIESDREDWTGLFGSFMTLGGEIIDNDYEFRFINNDGTLKK